MAPAWSSLGVVVAWLFGAHAGSLSAAPPPSSALATEPASLAAQANERDRALEPAALGTRRQPAALPAAPLPAASDVRRGGWWPRFRGPGGQAIADGAGLPDFWDRQHNIAWVAPLDGEGSSSPVVAAGRVYLTSSLDWGSQRRLHCFDLDTGQPVWTRTIDDPDPEVTSALTGHAASTPATNGRVVVAWFGRAGLVAYDTSGAQLWRVDTGRFETELGLASSPIIVGQRVLLVCDHDGDRFRSFDSYLLAVDLATGVELWKAPRRGSHRSWSTPIVAGMPGSTPAPDAAQRHIDPDPANVLDPWQAIVAGPDAVRAYRLTDGRLLWTSPGLTDWVAPSPVIARELLLASSGPSGLLVALRLPDLRAAKVDSPPGDAAVAAAAGEPTAAPLLPSPEIAWQHATAGAYVCSPLAYRGRLYVHDEQGVLTIYDVITGERLARRRLSGKFVASGLASDGRVLLTNDAGTTYVLRSDDDAPTIATNPLDQQCLASPAVAGDRLLLRTASHLYCIRAPRPAGQ